MCGQTCVAMVSGVTIDEAVQATGKKRGTNAPDLIAALERLKASSAGKMSLTCLRGSRKIPRFSENIVKSLPTRCICRVRSKGWKGSHWVLLWDGTIYDPYPEFVPWQYVSSYIDLNHITFKEAA